jgi:TonB-linked SusC/RagA family outer membrane protein
MLTFLVPRIVSAQTKAIKGTVLDEAGLTLPGATVLVKGTKTSTITNETGEFSIVADAKAILLVSFTGFVTREITISGQSSLRIQLEPTNQELTEVVVVAYGKQTKPTVTGAIATVSGNDLRQSPVANLTNALAGRLPGLFTQQNSGQPGKDQSNIQIRGISSYRGGSSPLFIVDGVQQDDIGQIDMNEISSISILKDASATAVYGVRGANGVIIVTTRRGKTGEAKVSINSQMGINVINRLPKFLNAYDALTLLKESYENDGQATNFPYTAEEMEHYRTGDMPAVYPNTDWIKEVTRKASMQSQVNVNVQGGTERVKYFISGGYLYQNGIFKSFSESETDNDYYLKRYNFRSNLDINVNKNLDLTLNLSSIVQNVNQPHPIDAGRSPFTHLLRLGFEAYNFPVYNPDGTYGAPSQSNNHPNMVGQLTLAGYDRTYKTDANATLAAVHKLGFITKGLSAKMQMAFNNTQTSYRSLYRSGFPSYRYNPRNDTYALFNAAYPVIRPFQTGTGDDDMKKPRSIIDLQASLNYDNHFGKHTVNLLAMYTQNTTTKGADRDVKYLGYVGRMVYNYNKRYLLEASAGYNGSNLFNGTNRFGFFPAASAGWVVSEESFLKNNLKAVNFLKIRGSYGLTGNDNVGIGDLATYPYQSTYIDTGSYGFGASSNTIYKGLAEGKIGNPNLTWEIERKSNIGLEAEFLDSKFKLTFDYFDNYRHDIITTRATVGQVVGVTFPDVNLGKVSNKGYELELGHNNRIGQVGYFINANISFAKNKILERDEPTLQYSWLQTTGKPIGQQFGWKALGFFQDEADLASSAKPLNMTPQLGDLKFQDLNGDGIIDDNDKGPIGNPQIPNTTYGISAGVNYKGFDCSVLFQGAMNGSVRLSSEVIWDNVGRFQEMHLDRWTPETAQTATYPKLHLSSPNNKNASSFWLLPADYLRLKNVELGYKLTPKFIQRYGIESVRLHLNGSNLITWDKLKIVDPESPSGSGTNYPQQKVYSFGMNLNF